MATPDQDTRWIKSTIIKAGKRKIILAILTSVILVSVTLGIILGALLASASPENQNSPQNSSPGNATNILANNSAITSLNTTSGFTSVINTSTIIYLTWNSQSDTSSFRLQRSIDSSNFFDLAILFQTFYADSQITIGQQYFYRLMAISGQIISSSVNLTTRTIAQPSKFIIFPYWSDQNNISWANQSGITGFVLQRSLDNITFTTITEVSSSTTTYIDTGLRNGTNYYYRLISRNNMDLSSPIYKKRMTYGNSIVITSGGTYSGSYLSLDPDTPAVLIKTQSPVIIENCYIKSKSHLITNSYVATVGY